MTRGSASTRGFDGVWFRAAGLEKIQFSARATLCRPSGAERNVALWRTVELPPNRSSQNYAVPTTGRDPGFLTGGSWGVLPITFAAGWSGGVGLLAYFTCSPPQGRNNFL